MSQLYPANLVTVLLNVSRFAVSYVYGSRARRIGNPWKVGAL